MCIIRSMNKSKTKIAYIRLSDEVDDWFSLQAESQDRTKSSLIRIALEDYIKNQKLGADMTRAHAVFARPGVLDVSAPHETE